MSRDECPSFGSNTPSWELEEPIKIAKQQHRQHLIAKTKAMTNPAKSQRRRRRPGSICIPVRHLRKRSKGHRVVKATAAAITATKKRRGGSARWAKAMEGRKAVVVVIGEGARRGGSEGGGEVSHTRNKNDHRPSTFVDFELNFIHRST